MDMKRRDEERRIFSPTVIYLLLVAYGTMLTAELLEVPLLLYMRKVHLATSTQSSFYVSLVSMEICVPVVSTIIFGHMSSKTGPGKALSMSYFVIGLGVLIVALSRGNKVLFVSGFMLYALVNGVRLLRYAIIGDVVPESRRTMIMGVHVFMAPLANVTGPMVWLVCQMWRGEMKWKFFVLDRFTVELFLGVVVAFTCSVICYWKLRVTAADKQALKQELDRDDLPLALQTNGEEGSREQRRRYGSFNDQGTNTIPLENVPGDNDTNSNVNSAELDDGDWSKEHWVSFTIFTSLLVVIQLTYLVALTTFQPILIERFYFDDEKVGKVYFFAGLFALLPPLWIILLSFITTDRVILASGFLLKMTGILFYLPLFSSLGYWQVVIAVILLTKGSMFCTITVMSLFTKVFGGSKSSTCMAYAWSISSLLPAVTLMAISGDLVAMFNTWKLSALLLPTGTCFLVVLFPMSHKYLGMN